MEKEEMIDRIYHLIMEHGPISTGELQLDSSPCYHSLGDNVVALIERFRATDVNIVVYVHEMEVDDFDLPYTVLSDDLLHEIYQILEDYDTEVDKTMKRCEN